MKKYFYIVFIFITALSSYNSFGQQEDKNIIQFTGVVVSGDSAYGLPNMAVYVPRTGQGVFTNHIGYFSLPVLSGDTVRIKGTGFIQKDLVMPDSVKKLSLVIEMSLDTVMLPEITLWPYPDFKDFEEAFLALELESEHKDFAVENLNKRILRHMVLNTEAGPGANYRQFLLEQANRQQYGHVSPTISLLNPFAWSRFINEIQNGGLKNKRWEEIDKRKHEKEEAEAEEEKY